MDAQAPEFTYVGSIPSESLSRPRADEAPLAGLRLAVKDLFHIAGIATSAGNPDWLTTHPIPEQTSPAVQCLLDAGAEFVGKTLTDELAYSLNGINAHYGTPINARAPDRLPGGSTSGSAVAVAKGCADIGLGTDTGGSIRVPASYNGLFGFRPSHGRISTECMVGLAPCFDTVGWLCRDVETICRVADVFFAAASAQVSVSTAAPIQHVQIVSLGDSSTWREAIQRWRPHLEDQLATVAPIRLDDALLNRASEAFRVLQGRAIWREHGDWILSTQPHFAPDVQARLRWCHGLDNDDEGAAGEVAEAFLDVWHSEVIPSASHAALMPTTPGAAPLLTLGDQALAQYRTMLMGLTAPAGLSRAPQLSLPCLQDAEAPWGTSLMGRYGQDSSLLALATSLAPCLNT